jgi:Uma2 family endonuclease
LTELFGMDKLRAQLPIEVDERDKVASFPEPDVAVIIETSFQFRSFHPRGDELQLLVEVADTSVNFDLTVKSGLYARAGVREYWVLDVRERAVFVHRALRGGRYTQITEFGESDRVMPEAMTGAGIEVRELLP